MRKNGHKSWLLAVTGVLLVSGPSLVYGQKPTEAPSEEAVVEAHNRNVAGWDAKVRFWGKVVDQNNMPIPGVEVKASITTMRIIVKDGQARTGETVKAVTAADGSFVLEGAQGFSLEIRGFAKEGYTLPPALQYGLISLAGTRYRYRYTPGTTNEHVYVPDSSKPEIFQMYKLEKLEPLVSTIFNRCRFKAGMKPKPFGFNYDLPDGDPGNFSVEFTSIGTPALPRWRLEIKGRQSGGVRLPDPGDAFLFTAPETGYQPSITFDYSLQDAEKAGAVGIPVRFFVTGNKGRLHGAVEFRVTVPDENGDVIGSYAAWANPSGSRNLQFDVAHPLNAK